MIPVRLALRNFMCYRDSAEVLDLTGVHLACLSGENGAGKSALLEAITWSLWGKARNHNYDDELISKGATEMEVDFHFVLGSQHCRVVRKRLRKGTGGTTMLELQVSEDGEADSWRGVSGDTVRDTQARINDLLKIDYETFINSAFILQGRADEFTVKSAADRKKVLADILGLAQYDRLEEQAKEELKERKAQINEHERRIELVGAELSKRPGYEAELGDVESRLVHAQDQLAACRLELAEVRLSAQRLEQGKTRLAELQERVRKREESIVATQERRAKNIVERESFEALLARREEIEKGYADLLSAEAEDRRFSEVISQRRKFEVEYARAEQLIAVERARLASRQSQIENDIDRLAKSLAGRDSVIAQLNEVRGRLSELDSLQQKYEDDKCSLESLDVRMRTMTNELSALEVEGKQLRQKLEMLTEAHSKGRGHAGCPLCGTDLTVEALDRVKRSYQSDIDEKRREYNARNADLKALNKEIAALTLRTTQQREQLQPVAYQRQLLVKSEERLKSLDEDEAMLDRAEAELTSVKTMLAEGSYAHDERRREAELRAQLKELDYDDRAHEEARARAAGLRAQRFDEMHHGLASAERELERLTAYIDEAGKSLEAWATEQAAEREEVAALRPEVDRLEGVRQTLKEKQQEEAGLAGGVSALSEERGGLRNKLAHCDTLQEEQRRFAARLTELVEEKGIFEELSTAFGKKGIQAMIIENIIPEIEDEANALLGRMTDGRMTVHLNTQRDAKTTKNVIETLDLDISDEVGTRPYELYSGGEAFRVNFALRIALSKLLARRAGTQLQTLVIDEGFGSQDGRGREKLVSAIRSIQQDFEKILVITHIEELKDEFPVRINVIKTATGSRVIMGEE